MISSGKSGKTAEECIRFSAEHGWRGFEAAWMEKDEQRRDTRPAPRRQETFTEHWARVDKELAELVPGYGKHIDNQ